MSGLSHVVFLVLTIIFWPFLFLWIICAVSASNSRKKKEQRSREEEIELLKSIELQMRRNK